MAGDVGNNVNYAIRIGFYNSNSSPVNADFSTASNSWIGLFGASGNRNGSGAKSNNFYQASNGDNVLDAGDVTPDTAIGGTARDSSSGSRTITFRVEKTSATDLSLQLISGSVNHTDTLAIASAPTTSFDALAVSMNFGHSTHDREASFDNIAVTMVPEPSMLSLVAIVGIATMMMRRRRA